MAEKKYNYYISTKPQLHKKNKTIRVKCNKCGRMFKTMVDNYGEYAHTCPLCKFNNRLLSPIAEEGVYDLSL